MPDGVATSIARHKALSSQRRADHHRCAIDHLNRRNRDFEIATELRHRTRNTVDQHLRQRIVHIAFNVKKHDAELTDPKLGRFRSAPTAEREPFGQGVLVELEQNLVARWIDDFDLLDLHRIRRGIAKAQFVNQMALSVGAGHRPWRRENIRDQRRQSRLLRRRRRRVKRKEWRTRQGQCETASTWQFAILSETDIAHYRLDHFLSK